jgi:hypothetical protein
MADPTRIRRTAVEIVRDHAATWPSISAFSLSLGLSRTHLALWLREPERGLREPARSRIAKEFGWPVEVVERKNEPVGRVVRELRRRQRKAA